MFDLTDDVEKVSQLLELMLQLVVILTVQISAVLLTTTVELTAGVLLVWTTVGVGFN